MSIDPWYAALAATMACIAVGGGCRWWFGRQLQALRHERNQLDADHQSTLRMASQTRKQVDDLQRTINEYRRKLSALELERRRISAKLTAMMSDDETPMLAAAAARMPASWADTQPM